MVLGQNKTQEEILTHHCHCNAAQLLSWRNSGHQVPQLFRAKSTDNLKSNRVPEYTTQPEGLSATSKLFVHSLRIAKNWAIWVRARNRGIGRSEATGGEKGAWPACVRTRVMFKPKPGNREGVVLAWRRKPFHGVPWLRESTSTWRSCLWGRRTVLTYHTARGVIGMYYIVDTARLQISLTETVIINCRLNYIYKVSNGLNGHNAYEPNDRVHAHRMLGPNWAAIRNLHQHANWNGTAWGGYRLGILFHQAFSRRQALFFTLQSDRLDYTIQVAQTDSLYTITLDQQMGSGQSLRPE